MMTFGKTWRLLVGCLALIVALVGCFQPTNDSAGPTVVASGVPSATATPQPTDTPDVTPTQELEAEAVLETAAPDETDEIDLVSEPLSTSVAQVDADEYQLTATAIVAEITATHEYSLTQTAIAAGIGQPTLTPVPQFTNTPVGLTPQVPLPGGACVHQVVAGDNLFRISLRYGVSLDQLAAANGISNIQLIRVNQRITIPGCGTTGNVPPPTTSAGLDPQNPGGGVVNPGGGTATCPGTYTVQQYDTLFQISLQCGVPMQSIANANGIANPNIIIIGSQLAIPSA